MAPRFSEHFGLELSQAELDFVDIELEGDLPLFVDPYALSIYPGEWYEECHALLIHFFSLLLSRIRSGDHARATEMLGHLSEPNDTRLGLSKGKPSGRGIGPKYATDFYDKIVASRAAQTGQLTDISDCELMIEGVGSDRISDMTINIIRSKLLEYTQNQCAVWGVPVQQVPSGLCWDADREGWVNSFTRLPVYKGSTIVLVPRIAVRYRSVIDHEQYYNGFVLNYLQAEHLSANTSLVKVLKNEKRVVYKKDLKVVFPLKKDNISEFAEKKPKTLEKYKAHAKAHDRAITPEGIESRHSAPKEIRYDDMGAKLRSIPSGREHADEFHNVIVGALETIFSPDLMNPKKEERIHDGRKRIDIVFDNSCVIGFFHSLHVLHRIHCPFIFVECKNYQSDMGNPEFDQLTGRFSKRRGQFGLLVCRDKGEAKACAARCKDVMNDDRGVVLVLDDNDIINLLDMRARLTRDQINDHMSKLLRDVMM